VIMGPHLKGDTLNNYNLKPTDPIIVPDVAWTKERIVDQMEEEAEEAGVQASDISDEDAHDWVEENDNIMFNGLSYGEDYYGRNVRKLNETLIKKTVKQKG